MAEELYKAVEIDGERYSIKKFTAIAGLQIAKMILSKLTPMLPYLDGSDEVPPEAMAEMMHNIGQMSDEDVENLVKKCLKCCYKVMPAGLQAVIDTTGHYGVEGVEYDLVLTCRLCIEAIKWGTSDFFGEKGSTLISEVVPALSQPNP